MEEFPLLRGCRRLLRVDVPCIMVRAGRNVIVQISPRHVMGAVRRAEPDH
jgi:hypothetical protein